MNPVIGSSSSLGGAMQPSGAVVEQAVSKAPMPNLIDTKVVAKVINQSEIKPSTVNQTSQVSRETIEQSAKQIQEFVQSMGRNLNFSIDQTTGYHVVRVVNPDTNEIIRQLPSEELLRIAQSMDSLKNALVSQKA